MADSNHDIFKRYHSNGNLRLEVEIVDGSRHGYYRRYHDNGTLEVEIYFEDGRQKAGPIDSYHPNGQIARRVYVNAENLINGDFEEFFSNGNLKARGFYLNDVRFEREVYYINKVLKKKVIFDGTRPVSSVYRTEDNEILDQLSWFNGELLDYGMKIRKYKRTNRYQFNPRIICLDRVGASVFAYLVSLIDKVNTVNFNGELAYKSKRNKSFKDETDIYIEKDIDYAEFYEALTDISLHIPHFYDLIFGQEKDLLLEFSEYKILNTEWNSGLARSYALEKDSNQNIFFTPELLKVVKGQNPYFSSWVVIDESVIPAGIVYESESKEKCEKWTEEFPDYGDDSVVLTKLGWLPNVSGLNLERVTE